MFSNYRSVWLWFAYFWIIFGVGVFIGQFIPPSIRMIISIVLLVIILGSLIFKGNRRWGVVIMHVYAIGVGIISYSAFMRYLSDLGTQLFIGVVIMSIVAFLIFGIIGFFMIKDASSMGKYLFVTLIALIVASIVGIFFHNPIFIMIITVIGLFLFLLYTLYDFNRMKRGQFEPMEMGFNLFLNLLNIILDMLRLVGFLND